MAYAYNIAAALELMRQVIVSDFTAQGEIPASVPYSFTAQQYPAEKTAYPATVIEVKRVSPDDLGVNSVKISIDFILHHYRIRASDNNAEIVALARFSHLAATIATDHKLTSFGPSIDILRAIPGEVNTVQEPGMNASNQNISIAHVSMAVEINWTENKYL